MTSLHECIISWDNFDIKYSELMLKTRKTTTTEIANICKCNGQVIHGDGDGDGDGDDDDDDDNGNDNDNNIRETLILA